MGIDRGVTFLPEAVEEEPEEAYDLTAFDEEITECTQFWRVNKQTNKQKK